VDVDLQQFDPERKNYNLLCNNVNKAFFD